jgi:radical SAM protein with 4Fe4S-binding SPASM domain
MSVYTTCYGMKIDDVERICTIPFTHFCIHLPDADGDMLLHPDENYCKVLQAVMRLIPQHNFVVYGRLHPSVRAALGHDVMDSTGGLISRAGNLPERKVAFKTGPLQCPACGPELNHNVLMPNGDVALCCMDYGLDHVLGNLTRQSYESLFEGDTYKHVMRGLLDPSLDTKCRYCEISTPA